MRPTQSAKDFSERIAAAKRSPLGWAVLPGTENRPAVRITVLCMEGEHDVWVQFRTNGGADIEVVPFSVLTLFVANGSKGLDAPG